MSQLFERMMTSCVLLHNDKEPDGEGGTDSNWWEANRFLAAICLDTSLEARKAEQASLSRQYTIATHRDISLGFHDVLRRVSDGAVFRVTSCGGDRQSPGFAGVDLSLVTAERWELT